MLPLTTKSAPSSWARRRTWPRRLPSGPGADARDDGQRWNAGEVGDERVGQADPEVIIRRPSDRLQRQHRDHRVTRPRARPMRDEPADRPRQGEDDDDRGHDRGQAAARRGDTHAPRAHAG